jgi:hypothetical protein
MGETNECVLIASKVAFSQQLVLIAIAKFN